MMSRVSFRLLICLALVAILPLEVRAWGFTGHEVIAHLAYSRLSPATRAKVTQILGESTIEQAASWPDSLRDDPQWLHTKRYHFKNIAREKGYLSQLAELSAQARQRGDLVMALIAAEEIMVNPSIAPEEKRKALAFYIHFFADLHQPLHVGYRHDIGGNIVRLDWYGIDTNLHSLWDRHLLGSFIFREFPAEMPRPISTAEIANKILAFEKWPSDSFGEGSYLRWLEEILSLRDKTYEGLDKTNDEYFDLHIGTLRRQLLLASDRLARKLEKIFSGKADISVENQHLRQQILTILPAKSMSQVVEFRPRPTEGQGQARTTSEDPEQDCDH